MTALGRSLDFYARVVAANALLLGVRVWHGLRPAA
jgi:hypothetical protein